MFTMAIIVLALLGAIPTLNIVMDPLGYARAAGWRLGTFGSARLAFFLTRSNLLSVLALAGVASIDRGIAPWFPQEILIAWYGFSTAWLIAVLARERARCRSTWAILVVTLSINLLAYLIIVHSAAFLTVTVLQLLCGLTVASRPSREKSVGVLPWRRSCCGACTTARGLRSGNSPESAR
ncbi:MAG: hypothetical protein DMF98_00905 [Acidobacteria bacterium]|nr:MAG: hypothetical protein DMF98_00905 [Acidobacteriota bacterium]